MDLHQLRLALLKISVLVLIGTSWVFASFVMESRPEEDQDADPITSLVRLPASLPAQLPGKIPGVFVPQVKAPDPVRMDVVKVPCWDSSHLHEQDIDARWIRLVGKACQNDVPAESITIRNQANGYEATVFNANRGSFTTDFIPLEPGKNEVLIRFESEPGVSLENEVTFNR
jgi:hypothetical protein